VNSVLARARETRLLTAGAVAFAVVLALYTAYALIRPYLSTMDPVDLQVYVDGGLIVRHVHPFYDPHAAAPLYDWGGYSSLALKFTYPPFAAVSFALISFVPFWFAKGLAMGVNVIALVAALWFTFGGLGYRDTRVRAGATLLTSAAVFWTEPVLRTMYLGQVNLVLMALIIWDLCQPSGRWWKGVATGVAAGIKLTPLIFIPYLLLTRRFREAIAACAGFLATVLVGFAFLPSDSAKWWLHGLIINDGTRTGFTGWAGNQSLRGIITRLSGSIAAGNHAWIAADVIVIVLGLAGATMLSRAGYPMPALLLTALIGLLVSPISWDHHWVWIAPGFAVAAHYAVRFWNTARARAVGCIAVAVGILAVYGAWPTSFVEKAQHLGNDSLGLIWLPGNTSPVQYTLHGDQRSFIEYHWHGIQLLTGNAYILGGLVLFAGLLIVALLVRTSTPARLESQDAQTSGEPSTDTAQPSSESAQPSNESADPARDSAKSAPRSRASH
jgi:Glycosyltransferase family 87